MISERMWLGVVVKTVDFIHILQTCSTSSEMASVSVSYNSSLCLFHGLSNDLISQTNCTLERATINSGQQYILGVKKN